MKRVIVFLLLCTPLQASDKELELFKKSTWETYYGIGYDLELLVASFENEAIYCKPQYSQPFVLTNVTYNRNPDKTVTIRGNTKDGTFSLRTDTDLFEFEGTLDFGEKTGPKKWVSYWHLNNKKYLIDRNFKPIRGKDSPIRVVATPRQTARQELPATLNKRPVDCASEPEITSTQAIIKNESQELLITGRSRTPNKSFDIDRLKIEVAIEIIVAPPADLKLVAAPSRRIRETTVLRKAASDISSPQTLTAEVRHRQTSIDVPDRISTAIGRSIDYNDPPGLGDVDPEPQRLVVLFTSEESPLDKKAPLDKKLPLPPGDKKKLPLPPPLELPLPPGDMDLVIVKQGTMIWFPRKIPRTVVFSLGLDQSWNGRYYKRLGSPITAKLDPNYIIRTFCCRKTQVWRRVRAPIRVGDATVEYWLDVRQRDFGKLSR